MQLQYLGYDFFYMEEQKLSEEITMPKDNIVIEKKIGKNLFFHLLFSGSDSLLFNTKEDFYQSGGKKLKIFKHV